MKPNLSTSHLPPGITKEYEDMYSFTQPIMESQPANNRIPSPWITFPEDSSWFFWVASHYTTKLVINHQLVYQPIVLEGCFSGCPKAGSVLIPQLEFRSKKHSTTWFWALLDETDPQKRSVFCSLKPYSCQNLKCGPEVFELSQIWSLENKSSIFLKAMIKPWARLCLVRPSVNLVCGFNPTQ